MAEKEKEIVYGVKIIGASLIWVCKSVFVSVCFVPWVNPTDWTTVSGQLAKSRVVQLEQDQMSPQTPYAPCATIAHKQRSLIF